MRRLPKTLIAATLLFYAVDGWGADIAKDINITVKKSASTTAITPSTSSSNNNELYLMIGAQPTSTPKLPSTTSSLVFTTITILTNGGTVGAFVACSSQAVTSKTFTWNNTASDSVGFQLISFTNTGCSPANPMGGIGNTGTSIVSSGGSNTTLASQVTTSIDRSYVVAVGVDASNGDTLVADSSDTFALSYTTDTSTAWSGWVLLRTTVSTPSGSVVVSSVSAVTAGGGSLAALSIEILPVTTPTVITAQPTAATKTTATGNATAYTGGSAITDEGVCYNLTGNPRSGSDTCVSGGSTEGAFTASLTGLSVCTRYFTAGYATNAIGTTYGVDVPFVTLCNSGAFVTPGTGNMKLTPGAGNMGI